MISETDVKPIPVAVFASLTMPEALVLALLLLLAGAALAQLRTRMALRACRAQLHLAQADQASAAAALAQTRQSLQATQDAVREQERRRIGRDLHDDLGQHLLALKIEMSMLQVVASGAHPQLHQKLGNAHHTLDLTIASLRAIINNLRPIGLEGGLRCAIACQLSQFSRIHGISAAMHADPGAVPALPDSARDSMLFRLVQEALANVARHAQASAVSVALTQHADQLRLTIADNGIGLGAPGAGQGLRSMRERVDAFGGQLELQTRAGGGTAVVVTIPLAHPAALNGA